MKPSIGLNLRVTGHCNQGGRKYMEDAFVVAYQQTECQKDLEYAYFGIFDGHGGREAALFAKEHLMNNIVSQKTFWSDDDQQVLKAIRNGFLATHQAMWREVGNWPKTLSGLPSTSGTTSSIAFIRRKKLYIGHVGDSKIVLGYQLPGSTDWCACALTKDHKPESPEENLRIQNVGGLVLNKAGVDRVVWNRPRPDHKGPVRRSTPFDQIPFLAVARSLGDLWSYNYLRDEFVVSPDPDVKVVTINPQMHRCLILASDGLWNMLIPQQAVKIVQSTEEENEKLVLEGNKASGAQPINPSKLLVDAALKNWFDLRMRADNTSVVTVMLDPAGPPKCEVLLRQRVMKRLRPRDEQLDEAGGVSVETSGKDRRKNNDCFESQPVKERKRSSDSVAEPPNKERKLSEFEESVPRNLPKPVILSPQRVKKHKSPEAKPDEENETTKLPENVNSTPVSVTPITMKKKGHDPPKSGGSSDSPVKGRGLDWSKRPDRVPIWAGRFGEPSMNETTLTENSKDTPFPNPAVSRMESNVSKCEKEDVASQKNSKYSSSKENGRVHLCEVDNFFKLNDRTTENSNSSKPNAVSSKHKSVPPTVKNFRKSTLTRRTVAFPNVLRPRLPRRTFGNCRASMTRRSYTHNTRAQSGIRKLKV